ncbi:hypothetical protein HO133_008247 [Letharia lupina]|uniref:Uncharacterized protein n=1 Tax=Letharia lupina TaxID=560253 RepID=A0A8H6FH92_9LECA|nr:uncharacterized protein HO133_008247 [Letharia lupina]KAF6228517.1 hypothetical protein HO133_008247 [Letharia lupina]
MPSQPSFDPARFIRSQQITQPNQARPVTDVRRKDVIRVNELAYVAIERTLVSSEEPDFPYVRFRGRSVFDDIE